MSDCVIIQYGGSVKSSNAKDLFEKYELLAKKIQHFDDDSDDDKLELKPEIEKVNKKVLANDNKIIKNTENKKSSKSKQENKKESMLEK